MKRVKLVYFFFVLYILNIVSCTSAQDSNASCEAYILTIKKSDQYKKDSIFLAYTVNRWIDSSLGWFGHYNRQNATNGFYKVHIGDLFYDYAKQKLMAFVFIEYTIDYIDTTFEKIKSTNGHLFDSHTIMGYRDSTNRPWKLFELDELFMGMRGGSLASAANFHASIFLDRKQMEKRTSTKYFLPCEEPFWTSKPFWKMGDRVPGYYNFETYMNATPTYKNLRPFCNIKYPDSLLDLYKFE